MPRGLLHNLSVHLFCGFELTFFLKGQTLLQQGKEGIRNSGHQKIGTDKVKDNSINFFCEHAQQILPIPTLGERLGQTLQLGTVNPPIPPCNLFRAGNLQALAVLQGRDELPRLQQAFVGASVQPGIAPSHDFTWLS